MSRHFPAPSPLALLALLLLALLASTAVLAQPPPAGTQVSVCQTTYSNTIAESPSSNGNGQYWASQTYLTLTLNTTAAYGTFTSAGVVSVTGSRSVSDPYGLGTVANSVTVTGIIDTTTCNGCDNVSSETINTPARPRLSTPLTLSLASVPHDPRSPPTLSPLLRLSLSSPCDRCSTIRRWSPS